MDLTGKRAVVTGAASGIGKAIATDLVARGAQVLLSDVNAALLAEVAGALGNKALWQVCDVADYAQVEALAQRAADAMGGADLVFANAGAIASGPLLTTKPAEVQWILSVNIFGVWSTLSVFGRMMRNQPGGGRLCATGSEHSLGFQHAGAGIYTATKHAVLGMADVLRAELPENVSISVFCPGLVASGLGSGPRPAHIEPAKSNPEASALVQAKAMPAVDVAGQAIDRTLAGEFLIVTHPFSVKAAERRFAEISAAFAAQAPYTDEAERYDVNRVMAEVAAELKARSAQA
jgi:NAD(P)-dependent dehydrogenase (short-subunit alcohol dehydrogenase family)